MHDTPSQAYWHEPKAGETAGYGKFKRKLLPYDLLYGVGGRSRFVAGSVSRMEPERYVDPKQ